MKLLHKTLAVLPLAAACAAFGSSAQAQSAPAVVKFKGKVAKVTCTANIAGGDTVILPLVHDADFPSVSNTAGVTPFNVDVASCGKNPGIFAKTYFYNATPGAVVDGRLVLEAASSGAGWQYQLLPAAGDVQLPVGTGATPVSAGSLDAGGDIGSGSTQLTYRVRYYRSLANITAGEGSAQANYVLYYE